jgi:hypothetical protein
MHNSICFSYIKKLMFISCYHYRIARMQGQTSEAREQKEGSQTRKIPCLQ